VIAVYHKDFSLFNPVLLEGFSVEFEEKGKRVHLE
jgi:hypothetical protein